MKRKTDPYGRDIPSAIPRPDVVSPGEIVPGYNPPGIPPWLKPIPINTRNTQEVLRGYLNANEPKIARWLYSTWNAEREAIKYQELRNAVRDHEMPLEWILQWQQDYSRFVVEVLDPEWRKAIQSAGTKMGENIEAYAGRPFGFTPTGRRIEEWIQTWGSELAVALFDSQHQAMRAILRYYTVDNPVSPDELGRILRPVIGLTPKQAEAVRRFRENLIAEGLPLKKVEHQILNYAGYLHRFRALRIARTELSFSYNYGQLEAIRQAQEQGYFRGEVVKTWMTAEDERTCDFCGPLDGQMIGLEETFPGLTKKLPNVLAPPAHPMCRCTIGYQVLERR
ncbi:phage minor head protein [Thermoanaerobacterium thermosaccharolyticum]|uniref:phage minor head protein n=1 Tax=Thermoanaerobacterium thermosaccharolyticum TaxID=1517 RepID=UPI003DA8FE38